MSGHEPASPSAPSEEEKKDKSAPLDLFPGWDLNSVAFVWAHYGHPDKSLWLIYGNYTMRLPEIQFAADAKKQLVLKGSSPLFDVHIHPVRELLKDLDEGAFMIVFWDGRNFSLPGGWIQRVLLLQSEKLQSPNIRNPYPSVVIHDSSQHGAFNGRDLFNRSTFLAVSNFLNNNKVKVIAISVTAVLTVTMAAHFTAQIENLFKNLVEINATLPDFGIGRAVSGWFSGLLSSAPKASIVTSTNHAAPSLVPSSNSAPLQIVPAYRHTEV